MRPHSSCTFVHNYFFSAEYHTGVGLQHLGQTNADNDNYFCNIDFQINATITATEFSILSIVHGLSSEYLTACKVAPWHTQLQDYKYPALQDTDLLNLRYELHSSDSTPHLSKHIKKAEKNKLINKKSMAQFLLYKNDSMHASEIIARNKLDNESLIHALFCEDMKKKKLNTMDYITTFPDRHRHLALHLFIDQ